MKNKKLLFYARYVDDIIIIVKKDCYKEIHTKFNEYSKNLKFTVKKMIDNRINILDMTLKIRNSKLILLNYAEPQNQNKITDSKHEISPGSQKLGTLLSANFAEIYRSCSTTCTPKSHNHALESSR